MAGLSPESEEKIALAIVTAIMDGRSGGLGQSTVSTTRVLRTIRDALYADDVRALEQASKNQSLLEKHPKLIPASEVKAKVVDTILNELDEWTDKPPANMNEARKRLIANRWRNLINRLEDDLAKAPSGTPKELHAALALIDEYRRFYLAADKGSGKGLPEKDEESLKAHRTAVNTSKKQIAGPNLHLGMAGYIRAVESAVVNQGALIKKYEEILYPDGVDDAAK